MSQSLQHYKSECTSTRQDKAEIRSTEKVEEKAWGG